MKIALQIHKIIISIFMLTLLALLYVNQQTLVYQIGLNLKENNKIYSELLDHNRILVYNVLNLKSPVNLEAKLLAKEVELSMPHRWQVVKRDNSPAKFVHKDETKRGFFANLFIMGREAEASPNINNGFSLKRH